MRKNAILERVKLGFTGEITEKDVVRVLLKNVIGVMNRGFENMDTRFQLMEEQLDGVKRLIEQMGTDKRI
ncbi:MAG: hypothetical protein ACYDG2_16105 [Ruminiclostridium sp.]